MRDPRPGITPGSGVGDGLGVGSVGAGVCVGPSSTTSVTIVDLVFPPPEAWTVKAWVPGGVFPATVRVNVDV